MLNGRAPETYGKPTSSSLACATLKATTSSLNPQAPAYVSCIIEVMQKQRHHHSSFWEDFAEYLLGECKEVGKILGIVLLALYLCVSMIVGMYHVAIYLFW